MKYIVGVDGSESSLGALRYAAHLAHTQDAEVVAVTSCAYPATMSAPILEDWDPQSDAQTILDNAFIDAFGTTSPDRLSTRVVQGQPAQALLDQSDAEMIVVGSRDHGGFTGLLLGSVSSAMAEHATVPVLLYHHK